MKKISAREFRDKYDPEPEFVEEYKFTGKTFMRHKSHNPFADTPEEEPAE